MASFEGEPALCSRVYPEPWAWFHTFTSQEFWCSSWKTVKFHALYDFFITSSSCYFLQRVCGLCLGTTDPVLDEKCQCPPPTPHPLLSFSGCLAPELWSMISAGSLVTTDGEEKLTIKGRQSSASRCSQCTVLHVLLPPCTRGGVRLKRWTGTYLLDCMLLHANRCEYRHIKGNIKRTHGRFALNTIAQKCFCHADLAHCKEKLFPRSWGSQRVLETQMMTHLIACGNKNDLLPLNHLLWKW